MKHARHTLASYSAGPCSASTVSWSSNVSAGGVILAANRQTGHCNFGRRNLDRLRLVWFLSLLWRDKWRDLIIRAQQVAGFASKVSQPVLNKQPVLTSGWRATFLTSGGHPILNSILRGRGGLIRSCTSSRSVHSRATRCSVSVRVYWRDSMENCSARYVSCHHSFPFQARLIPGQACLYAFHTRTSLQSRAGQRGRFCRVATADAAVRSEAR